MNIVDVLLTVTTEIVFDFKVLCYWLNL